MTEVVESADAAAAGMRVRFVEPAERRAPAPQADGAASPAAAGRADAGAGARRAPSRGRPRPPPRPRGGSAHAAPVPVATEGSSASEAVPIALRRRFGRSPRPIRTPITTAKAVAADAAGSDPSAASRSPATPSASSPRPVRCRARRSRRASRCCRARYDVRHDEGVFARDGYLAGPDERRLAELTAALADPRRARDRDGARRLRADAAAAVRRPRTRWSAAAPDRRLLRRHGAAGARGARRRRVDPRPGRHAAGKPARPRDQRALFERLETPGPRPAARRAGRPDPGAGPGAAAGRQPGDVLAAESARPTCRTCRARSSSSRIWASARTASIVCWRTWIWRGCSARRAASSSGDFSGCREPEATRADSPTADEVLADRLGRLPIPGRAAAARSATARATARSLTERCASWTRTAGTLTALEGAVS